MKKNIIGLIIPLIFILCGLFVGVVPVIIPMAYQAENNEQIAEYNEKVNNLSDNKRKMIVDQMRNYNSGQTNYYTALEDEKIISYIDIPNINVYLPVYNGTDNDTLDRGIGIMENTSLPIGGIGSHCVLTGHSGLTVRTMFNNLDKLKPGDCFYLHTYGYTLSYRIYSVRTVLPDEVLENISRDDDRDLCTLLTCTPQGINSHRLLVMGERTTEPTVISRKSTSNHTATENATFEAEDSKGDESDLNNESKMIFPFTATMLVCCIVAVLLEIIGVICIIRLCKSIRNKDGGEKCNTC